VANFASKLFGSEYINYGMYYGGGLFLKVISYISSREPATAINKTD